MACLTVSGVWGAHRFSGSLSEYSVMTNCVKMGQVHSLPRSRLENFQAAGVQSTDQQHPRPRTLRGMGQTWVLGRHRVRSKAPECGVERPEKRQRVCISRRRSKYLAGRGCTIRPSFSSGLSEPSMPSQVHVLHMYISISWII